MNKPPRLASFALLTLLAGLFLAGCSIADDLRVVNNYPFAVMVRHKDGALFAVPARSTLSFDGAGGRNGDRLNAMTVEDAHHKPLQTLSQESPNVEHQSIGGMSGAEVWTVTLGPPSLPVLKPSPAAAKPFSIGWLFAGVAIFIGWIEWRAHRNEKSKSVP